MTTTVSTHELGRLPLFDGLPSAELEALARASRRLQLRDGEHLYRAGDDAVALYHVLGGQIVLRASERHVILDTVDRGGIVGWSALQPGRRRHSSAEAVGSVEVVEVPAEPVLDLAVGGSASSRVLVGRLLGLAADHVEASRAQVLHAGHEGDVTAG